VKLAGTLPSIWAMMLGMNKQQRLVLVVSILASVIAFLDSSIVNVALPAINKSLGGGLSAQQWIVDAYLLFLSALILIAGSLSDLFGRKVVIISGLIGFGAASVLCALAPSSSWLIIFRIFQGISGALLVPSSLALIIDTFSESGEGKAIGIWTAWTGVSFIVGPLLGGIIIDSFSWRWIFAINLLPIAITLFLLSRIDSPIRPKRTTKVDVVGAVIGALALGGPIFGLIEQSKYGWASPLIFLPIAIGLIALAVFLVYENKIKSPMLPLDLFKNHNFAVGNIATLGIYAGLSAATFLIVIYLQQVAGYTALSAGLALLPVTIIMFFLSSKSGALAAKYGPRLFMGLGPVIAGIGFLMMLRVGSHVNYWTQLFPAVMVFGFGLVTTVAPLTAAILGDVPSKQAGIASAVNNAMSRIAGLVAIALIGVIVQARFSTSLYHSQYLSGLPARDVTYSKSEPLEVNPPKEFKSDKAYKNVLNSASVSAFHSGVVTMSVLVIAGGAISLIGIKNKPTNPAKA
jgi:EmrB/QacA subfamily drug resistance transporter